MRVLSLVAVVFVFGAEIVQAENVPRVLMVEQVARIIALKDRCSSMKLDERTVALLAGRFGIDFWRDEAELRRAAGFQGKKIDANSGLADACLIAELLYGKAGLEIPDVFSGN